MSVESIRRALFLLNPDAELAESFDQVLDTGSLLRTDSCPVVDTQGNHLIKNGLYQYGERLIKIRSWEFGSGNLLDRYYRVFYTDDLLRDTFLVIEARYPNGVCGGAVYSSSLVLIRTES